MRRKCIIVLGVLACALLAIGLLFRPQQESVQLTGCASAGLVLLEEDSEEEGLYVLAVIDQSRADRSGIRAGDVLQTLNGTTVTDLADADDFFNRQAEPCKVGILRNGELLQISLSAP